MLSATRPIGSRSFSRHMPVAHRKALASYSRKSGKVNWAWAVLHDRLAVLFATLLADANTDIGPGLLIWDTLRNDGLARRELAELCTLKKKQKKVSARLLGHILWAIRHVNSLAEHRNQVAHAALSFSVEDPRITIPGLAKTFTSAYKDSAPKNVVFYPNRLWGDFYVLTQFVTELWVHAAFPSEYGPLPRRPRLQSLVKVRKGNGRRSRRRTRGRSRHRSSSPA